MLLILQRKGRSTANELARLLEVSQRTILRDVEALGEAGVPIYTTRGSKGGIELLDGFSTRLTGLTSDEAQSLLLVGQPAVAHRLGLSAPARSTRTKLLTALSPGLAEHAENLETWFFHDPDPWPGNQIPHGELRRLSGCIRRRRVAQLTFAKGGSTIVRPIGMVLKAGSWYLVTLVNGGYDVVCIDELRATRITRQTFPPPTEFDLAAFWRVHTASKVRAEFSMPE